MNRGQKSPILNRVADSNHDFMVVADLNIVADPNNRFTEIVADWDIVADPNISSWSK